jgi:hypothetical protein
VAIAGAGGWGWAARAVGNAVSVSAKAKRFMKSPSALWTFAGIKDVRMGYDKGSRNLDCHAMLRFLGTADGIKA